MKTIKEIKEAGLILHHTAWTRGYVSRKLDHATPQRYKGRFGEGYIVLSPSMESTRYCTISYYIRPR